MARIREDHMLVALKKNGCRPMDMTEKPMKGFVFIAPESFDLDKDLDYWVQLCLDHNPLVKRKKRFNFKHSKCTKMTNSINWFEIPVTDFARAKKFYETLYGAEIMEMPFPDGKYGMLPSDMEKGIGGGIAQYEGFEPSMNGALVYLNGGEDLSVPLSKVEAAGGKILLPKTSIGGNGFMAHIIDTEGNKIALHSMK